MATPSYWVPPLMDRQFDVFNNYSRFLLVEGPRLAGKCIDSETIVPCDGRLIRMGKLCEGLKPGEQRDAPHFVKCLAETGDQFITAGSSGLYRDACTNGMSLVSRSGYELKCSEWHPIYCYSEGRFAYRTSSEIAALQQSKTEVWIPISRGYGEWNDFPHLVLHFKSTNKTIERASKSHDVIAACIAEYGVTKLKDIFKLTGIHYSTIRSFFKQRAQITKYSVSLDEDVAYMLGLLTGDGCTTDKFINAHRIGFSSIDTDLTNEMSRILRSNFDCELKHLKRKCDWQAYSDKLRSMVIHLKINKYAHEKFIPDVILESPQPVLRAFIQGLFDTDGSALKSGHVEYCSASEQLARGVHQVLLAFGVKSSIRFKPNKCKGSWNIVITSDALVFYRTVGFRLIRKQDGWKRCERHHLATRLNYPTDIKPLLKSLYLSRHQRGAPTDNLSRRAKHSGFEHVYNKWGSVSVEVLSRFIDFAFCHSDEKIKKFFIEGNVFWETVKSVTPCKVSLFDFIVPTHHNFVAGGFINHNTVAVLHRIARHLWETNGAEVAMFSKIIKTAKNSGVYEELCVNVLPQWFAGGYFGGLDKRGNARWVKEGPITTDSVSKTPYFILRNSHGTTSRLSLFNCADDNEVETRTKNTRFSMIYFPELSNFYNRIVFDATQVQLRCLGLDYDSHQWIADTNPADEGEDSWIWKLWFREKFLPAENKDQEQFRNELESIHFEIADNTKIDPRQVASLRASYEYNPDLYNRYVKGHWTATSANSHFADLFIPNIHVVGDAFSPNKADWEVIVPDENCHEMFSGWDMGSVNHAGSFALKRIVNKQAHFDFIDELVFLKDRISIEDFAVLMLEKKHYWEDYCRREYGTKEINWRHWSDDSAWNYRSAANAEDELIVRNVTDGEIILLKAHKGAGSVELRINLVRKLLFQKRLAISAQLFETIRSIKSLKRGHNKSDIIDPVDPLKHQFDSFSYILIGESPLDAQNRTRPKVEKRSSVVAVGV